MGGTAVAVGGTEVGVGGTAVAVGGIGVGVGGTAVAVGGTAVAVGGTEVGLGAGVAVAMLSGVGVATIDVAVGCGVGSVPLALSPPRQAPRSRPTANKMIGRWVQSGRLPVALVAMSRDSFRFGGAVGPWTLSFAAGMVNCSP